MRVVSLLRLSFVGLFFVCGPGAGCTVITDFAGYRFVDNLDLATTVGNSDGGDASANHDLTTMAHDANGNADLVQPPSCPGMAECCAAVPCPAGGCCAQGTCVASGNETTPGMVCVDGTVSACGAANAPCCSEGRCDNQGCCVGGTCVGNSSSSLNSCGTALGSCMGGECVGLTSSCGASGDSCCPGGGSAGDFCTESGTVCANAQCQQCPLLPGGQFCCPGNWCPSGGCCDGSSKQCVDSGDSCSNGEGECLNGGCKAGACGKLNQVCCGSVGCTDALTRCSPTNACEACGGLDERCCTDSFCSEGYACDATDKCRRCGGPAQLCCPGSQCKSNYHCNSSGNCL